MKPPHKVIAGLVAVAALGGAVAGCADPDSPRYAYPQAYSYPTGYAYGAGPRYPQTSDWNAYRNYRGIHPGPELTFSVTPAPRAYYP